jgi:hypothetical protein
VSEVDRLSNSGLYPALPIADKRSPKDGGGAPPSGGKQPPDRPAPQAAKAADAASPNPSKSFIDEYA